MRRQIENSANRWWKRIRMVLGWNIIYWRAEICRLCCLKNWLHSTKSSCFASACSTFTMKFCIMSFYLCVIIHLTEKSWFGSNIGGFWPFCAFWRQLAIVCALSNSSRKQIFTNWNVRFAYYFVLVWFGIHHSQSYWNIVSQLSLSKHRTRPSFIEVFNEMKR